MPQGCAQGAQSLLSQVDGLLAYGSPEATRRPDKLDAPYGCFPPTFSPHFLPSDPAYYYDDGEGVVASSHTSTNGQQSALLTLHTILDNVFATECEY